MKSIRRVLLHAAMMAILGFGHAQNGQASDDVQTMLQNIEATTPQPASSAPDGTFYTVQHGEDWPPYPGDALNLPFWDLGNGFYLLDDRDVDYDALRAAAEDAAAAATPSGRFSMMASSLLNSSYAYGNPVYLTNMAATFDGSTTTASFSVFGGTNFVPYDILTTTNAANSISNWTWIGVSYTSNGYSFSGQPANPSYYILAKPQKTMAVGWGSNFYEQCDIPSGMTNAVQVAGGIAHSVALLNDGTVRAWGNNVLHQIDVPTNVAGAIMISSGWYHSLALLTNGTVVAWGLDGDIGFFPPWHLTDVPTNCTNITVISAQALHSLALTSNGTVVAWGHGTFGEASVPSGISNVVAITAGFEFNVVALSNGTVAAWGDDTYGQTNVPAGLSNVVDVAAGPYHCLALLTNGTVVAWGQNSYGQTNVPANLTNVVAIAAGGNGTNGCNFSLALRSDGTVVMWGAGPPLVTLQGMSNVVAIAAGGNHALAIRTGPRTPVITQEPADQYQLPGGSVTFAPRCLGLYGVTYQWQTNGVNLTGATSNTLTLTNVQTAQLAAYSVVVNDNGGMGSIVSSNASLYLVTLPVVNSESLPTNQFVVYQSSVTLSVGATAPGEFNGFPLSYRWQFDGTNITGQTSSNYTFTATNSGTYSVAVTNASGSTNVAWQITVVYPGGIYPWGSGAHGQLNVPQPTNVISLAAGKAHGVVALDDGSVTNWGSYWTGTNFVAVASPPLLTNALAVAAGSRHDVALKADGTVIAWGSNDVSQTNVPANATNIIAIATGGNQSLALKQDGTVLQWGQTNGPIPAGLTNVTAIAAGTNFSLALLHDSTVVAWGTNDYGQTNIPTGLSNVVAIAAAGAHALALRMDGTVTTWGALTNIPAGLSNVLNVAAGENHNIALKNDGTVIAWGDNTFGQTNVPNGLNGVKLVAGGSDFTLATRFSPLVQYPVNVANDLLLIYNTNSADSLTVLNYYLANRPGVSNANVMGIGYTNNGTNIGYYETINPGDFTNLILSPVQSWLTTNPVKRPGYVILFLDVPSRVNTNTFFPTGGSYPADGIYPSVQYQLNASCCPGWNPFVTAINMNSTNDFGGGGGRTNDCIHYIDKLKAFGTNNSIIISASGGNYGNTNYYFDDNRFSGQFGTGTNVGGLAQSGVLSVNPLASVTYVVDSSVPHITSATNVAGYLCWGTHSTLGANYPTNGVPSFHGNSGWYLIETVESFNGQRYVAGFGTFIGWYSQNAFGGTNYVNTPIGAVSHVDEPFLPGANDEFTYFGSWESGKTFAICAWASNRTNVLQAVGDPFVKR